jgi:GTP cyclohydrolase I
MNPQKKERLMQDTKICDRANAVGSLIQSIEGEDASREGLADTPLRVAAMYNELCSGYAQDGQQALRDAMFTDVDCKDMVLVKDIQFTSLCEHHIMPFFGTVAIAYIPQDGNIVGLSKLGRLVEIYARRLQVQERMGKQIADDIEAVMNPRALAVIIEAEHTCMTARGISKPGAKTVTSCCRGAFYTDEKARNELLMLLK